MRVVRDDDTELEIWRDGVETRMYASSLTGANQLTMFEQWCTPGNGAPPHIHAVEEILRVVSGVADVIVDRDRQTVREGGTVVIPAGAVHGFVNSGDATLRVLAILAAPIFEAHYVDAPRDSRRWQPKFGRH